jgi:hypothetical protein
MYLRHCLQELRIRLGETDLFLRGDGTDGDTHGSDGAMAMGRPIIAYQPTIHPVQRTSRLHPARSERSSVAQVAANELG